MPSNTTATTIRHVPPGVRVSRFVAFIIAMLLALAGGMQVAISPAYAQDAKEEANNSQNDAGDAFRDIANNGEVSNDDVDLLKDTLRPAFDGGSDEDVQSVVDSLSPTDLRNVLGNENLRGQLESEGLGGILNELDSIMSQAANEDLDLRGAVERAQQSTPTMNLYTHTEGDILSSVIFSKQGNDNGGAVTSTELHMNDLLRYPVETDHKQQYGMLEQPDGSSTASSNVAASHVAEMIKGLYGYHYLVGLDGRANRAESADPNVNPSLASKVLLGGGIVGANIFDGISSFLMWLEKTASIFNIGTLLALPGSESNGAEDNWLTNLVGTFFERLGLTNSSLYALQAVTLIVIGTIFILVLMFVMRSARGSAIMRDGRVKNYGARILVVIICIPFVVALTGTVQSMVRGFTENQLSDATTINSNIVLDSLDWAAGSNLSFAAAGVDWNAKAEDYAPDEQGRRVSHLAADATKNSRNAGGDDGNRPKAAELLSKYNSGETANVGDYFARISDTNGVTGSNTIAASWGPLAVSPGVNPGISQDTAPQIFDQANSMLGQGAFFLSDAPGLSDDDNDSNSSDDAPSGDQGGDDKNKDENKDEDKDKDENKDENKDEKKDEQQADGNTTSEDKEVGRTIHIGTEEFKCERMTCSPVQWNVPATYIYGATPAAQATEQTKNAQNFFAGQGSEQGNDPSTAERPSDDEKKKAWDSNAATIALANKYQGQTTANGARTLSNQSVAFLLQSRYADGTLQYDAYQASQSASGNTSAPPQRGEFVRYTIPNGGNTELATKITSLSFMWMMGGIISIAALLSLTRAGIFRCLLMMLRGFFSAFLLGNISGLINYFLYYIALTATFVSAIGAIVVSMKVSTQVAWALGGIRVTEKVSTLLRTDREGFVGDQTGANQTLNAVSAGVNTVLAYSVATILCVVCALVLCWPMVRMPNGEKASLIRVMTSLPILLADALSAKVDQFASKLGHKPNKTVGNFDDVNLDKFKPTGKGKNGQGTEQQSGVGTAASAAGRFAGAAVGGPAAAALGGAAGRAVGNKLGSGGKKPSLAIPMSGRDGGSAAGGLPSGKGGPKKPNGPQGQGTTKMKATRLDENGNPVNTGNVKGVGGSDTRSIQPGDERQDGVIMDSAIDEAQFSQDDMVVPAEDRQSEIIETRMDENGVYQPVGVSGGSFAGGTTTVAQAGVTPSTGGALVPAGAAGIVGAAGAAGSSGTGNIGTLNVENLNATSGGSGTIQQSGRSGGEESTLRDAAAAGAAGAIGAAAGSRGSGEAPSARPDSARDDGHPEKVDKLVLDADNVELNGADINGDQGSDMSSVQRDAGEEIRRPSGETGSAPQPGSGRDAQSGQVDTSRIEQSLNTIESKLDTARDGGSQRPSDQQQSQQEPKRGAAQPVSASGEDQRAMRRIADNTEKLAQQMRGEERRDQNDERRARRQERSQNDILQELKNPRRGRE